MASVVLAGIFVTNNRKKVLVVEDNADWRDLLSMVIRRLGHEVVIAGTGEEGVRQASVSRPDLILMDLGLPKMGGDEATAQIKADATSKDIPVVIQTAFGTSSAATRAIEVGAVEIMYKPITIIDLQKMLSKYLSGGDLNCTPERARNNSPAGHTPAGNS
jgi:two-component system cell cycle response regulator DivK